MKRLCCCILFLVCGCGCANNSVVGNLIGSQSNGPSRSEIESQLRNRRIEACYQFSGDMMRAANLEQAADFPVLQELQNRGFVQISYQKLHTGVELIGGAPIYTDMAGVRLTDKGQRIRCGGSDASSPGLSIPVGRDIEIISIRADAGTAVVEYNQIYRLGAFDGNPELSKRMDKFVGGDGLPIGTPERAIATFYRFGDRWKLQ